MVSPSKPSSIFVELTCPLVLGRVAVKEPPSTIGQDGDGGLFKEPFRACSSSSYTSNDTEVILGLCFLGIPLLS